MLFWIETRGRGDNTWKQRGTIVAVSSPHAASKAIKLLKISKSTQVRALHHGYTKESVYAPPVSGKLKTQQYFPHRLDNLSKVK